VTVLSLGGLAVLAALELSRDPPSTVVDPHFVAHGARAWRTLWLGIPTRTFVDAIPAMGPAEWSGGAAFSLGGEEGPRVLAVAVSALVAALLVAAAALTRGTRAGLLALASVALLSWARGPASLDRASLAGLGLAALAFVYAWLVSRTRVGAWLARLSRSADTSDPARAARSSRDGRTPTLFVASLVLALGALWLGLGPPAAASLVVLALAVGLDSLGETFREA
jgi:hypothetical protein